MLLLNRQADYGLRLMLEVACNDGNTVTTSEVARRQEIPYEFLRKVAQTLVTRGLLVSQRGSNGGLSLATSPDRISLLDIVGAFDLLSLNCCTMDPPRCQRRDICPVYPVWVEAQSQVERVLGGTVLSDVVERQAARNRRPGLAPAGAPA